MPHHLPAPIIYDEVTTDAKLKVNAIDLKETRTIKKDTILNFSFQRKTGKVNFLVDYRQTRVFVCQVKRP